MSGWGMVQESPTSCIHRQKFASRAIFGFQKFPRKFASPTENGTTSKFPKEFLEFLGKPNGRIPMTVCSLGKDAGWDDPTKIPIEDIIELWREQSSKGEYANSLYWGAARACWTRWPPPRTLERL
jgi:hypothetical protein